MTMPLCNAVTNRNDTSDFLIVCKRISFFLLTVCKTNPTGIQAQDLGIKHEHLTIIACPFIKVVAFLAYNDKIIFNAMKRTIRVDTSKGTFFIDNELHIQSTDCIEFIYFLL